MAANGLLNNPAMFAGYSEAPAECVADFVSLDNITKIKSKVRLTAEHGLAEHLFHQHLIYMLRPVMTPYQRYPALNNLSILFWDGYSTSSDRERRLKTFYVISSVPCSLLIWELKIFLSKTCTVTQVYFVEKKNTKGVSERWIYRICSLSGYNKWIETEISLQLTAFSSGQLFSTVLLEVLLNPVMFHYLEIDL